MRNISRQPIPLTVYKDIYDFYPEGCEQTYPPFLEIMGTETMATEEIQGDCLTDNYFAGDIVPSSANGTKISLTKLRIDGYFVWVSETIQEIQALLNPCCVEAEA